MTDARAASVARRVKKKDREDIKASEKARRGGDEGRSGRGSLGGV